MHVNDLQELLNSPVFEFLKPAAVQNFHKGGDEHGLRVTQQVLILWLEQQVLVLFHYVD